MTEVWARVRLGDVLVDAKPGFASGHDLDQGLFQFRMNNVTRDGRLDLSKRRRVPHDTKGIDSYLLRLGDVLFNATNSPELVGKSAYIGELDEPAVFSNHFLRLRPNPDRLDPTFLWRWLQLQWHQGLFRSRARQWVNQASYGREELMDILIPLPDLSVQRKIVAVLGRVDDLKANRRRSLAVVDSLATSTFLRMFGNPSSNPFGWPIRTLGSLGRIVTGNTPSRAEPAFYGDWIEWIKSDNIRPPLIRPTKAMEALSEAGARVARVVPAGSLLITCIAGTPASIGNVALTDRVVAFNQQINALVPESSNSRYLHTLLTLGQRIVQQASTASMKGMISKSRFASIQLPVAPVNLQHDFARLAAISDRCRERVAASAHEMEALFSSLQSQAFAGQL